MRRTPALALRGRPARTRRAQSGLGMIELMIVVLISTVMMAGLLTIVYGTRQNFTAQSQLAQMQDNERLAMTLITNVVQNAGYFPDPVSEAASVALPVATPYTTAGQSIYGTAATGSNSDQIQVRYLAGTSDGTMDCLGVTNTSAGKQMDVNTLWVDKTNKQLKCTATDGATATTQVLVNGVINMALSYGLSASGGTSVVEYVPAASMVAAQWPLVVSVQLTLTFAPSAVAAGANAFPSTWNVSLSRTIDLLNRV